MPYSCVFFRSKGKIFHSVRAGRFHSVRAGRSACFETAFHVTMVMICAMHGSPHEGVERHGVRCYEFHGFRYSGIVWHMGKRFPAAEQRLWEKRHSAIYSTTTMSEAFLRAIGGAQSLRVGCNASGIFEGLPGGSGNMRGGGRRIRQSPSRGHESMGYIRNVHSLTKRHRRHLLHSRN